jgi:hypothetical protein
MTRKHAVLIAAAAAASVVALVGISDVFASSEALPGPGVIRLTSTRTLDAQVDAGRKGGSVGDVEIIRERLFNRRITPKSIGHVEMVCTATGGNSANCNGTYFLPLGRIVVSGPRTYRAIFEVAVVGGTGLYDNVKGTLTVTSLGGKPLRSLVFFRLLV